MGASTAIELASAGDTTIPHKKEAGTEIVPAPLFKMPDRSLVDSLATYQNHLGSPIGEMPYLIGVPISPPSFMHDACLDCVPHPIVTIAILTPVPMASADLDPDLRISPYDCIGFRLGP